MSLMKLITLLFPLFLMACNTSANALNAEARPATTNPEKLNPPTSDPTTEWADLPTVATQWKEHYKVYDPYTKVTNNNGDGYEDLYGTRNFRVVLHGVYYRGGANNTYNKYGKRPNTNPLQNGGLKNLFEEGFSTGIYFYPTHYSSAPKKTSCGDATGNNELDYKQITAFNSKNYEPLLNLIFQRIKGQLKGPIYGHCWNGWHASGLIASLALQQFCDWTNKEAGDYWVKNTDGNSKGYGLVLKQVTGFKKIAKLAISSEEKSAICPNH